MKKQTVLKVTNVLSKTKTWRWLKVQEVIKKELSIECPDSCNLRKEDSERSEGQRYNCRSENKVIIINKNFKNNF